VSVEREFSFFSDLLLLKLVVAEGWCIQALSLSLAFLFQSSVLKVSQSVLYVGLSDLVLFLFEAHFEAWLVCLS